MIAQELRRGTVRHFIMACDAGVGNVNFLRIWHDNSGEGATAGWFLDKVIIEDIAARRRCVQHGQGHWVGRGGAGWGGAGWGEAGRGGVRRGGVW